VARPSLAKPSFIKYHSIMEVVTLAGEIRNYTTTHGEPMYVCEEGIGAAALAAWNEKFPASPKRRQRVRPGNTTYLMLGSPAAVSRQY
jgi:hypothetical protein